MANLKTTIEEWAVKDLEDGSSLSISVVACTELGMNRNRVFKSTLWVILLTTNL
jgi:hypothetical protein